MHEVTIDIKPVERAGRPHWHVRIRHTGRGATEDVAQLSWADLRGRFTDAEWGALGVPFAIRDWEDLARACSPGAGWRPTASTLRALGAKLHGATLGMRTLGPALERVETEAAADRRPVRYLLDLATDASLDAHLAAFPIELAFADRRFVFRRPDRPSVRCNTEQGRREVRLPKAARVLVATAHDDGRPPTADALVVHANAIADAARATGWTPVVLSGATADELRRHLVEGEGFDVLYVACHGQADPDRAGVLLLRDGPLGGTELARWIEDDLVHGRRPQLAVFCACSSAMPSTHGETGGIAQWLLGPSRVPATVGFRGAVGVDWALGFTQRMFDRMGQGDDPELAFCRARCTAPDDDPQWVLPLYFGMQRDALAPAAAVSRSPRSPAPPPGLPPLRPSLPRQSRPYFTAREQELRTLGEWMAAPGRAAISSLEAMGGAGKTELALRFAERVQASGTPVIWLTVGDLPLREALLQLTKIADPAYEPALGADDETVEADMRRRLAPYDGLVVLDDIRAPRVVDHLVPGPQWNALVTTRLQDTLSGVVPLKLDVLTPADGVALLSRLVWGLDTPPSAEAAAAHKLVEQLDRLPLALVLAGSSLRESGQSVDAYAEELQRGEGAGAADREVVLRALERSLRDLPTECSELLLLLAAFPEVGAELQQLAVGMSRSEPEVDRLVTRLGRAGLAQRAGEAGHLGLHPRIRELTRRRAPEPERRRADARTVSIMAWTSGWVNAAVSVSGDAAFGRWRRVQLQFAEWRPWECNLDAPTAAAAARALAGTDQFLQFSWDAGRRLERIQRAAGLADAADPETQANVLQARGDLRRFRADLPGAEADYEKALALFEAVDARLGQANVLQARGDLALMSREDPVAAEPLYRKALAEYRDVSDRLGESNVLVELSTCRALLGDLAEAHALAGRALELAVEVQNRYAAEKANAILAAIRRITEGPAAAP